jgi:hypothetical protein
MVTMALLFRMMVVIKTFAGNVSIGYAKVAMEAQGRNIVVIHSVWRRLKKGHIVKVSRDLEPVKDVKGGGGVTGRSKPIMGSTGTTGSH